MRVEYWKFNDTRQNRLTNIVVNIRYSYVSNVQCNYYQTRVHVVIAFSLGIWFLMSVSTMISQINRVRSMSDDSENHFELMIYVENFSIEILYRYAMTIKK